jgi:hypothetical protein
LNVTKTFWGFLAAGLVIAGAFVYGLLAVNKSAHLELTGSILKVRVMALNPQASLVIADFRVTNPSGLAFVVKNVTVQLQPLTGDVVESSPISKVNLENVFKYEKLIGPQYNAALTIRDAVPSHGTLDRMVGARFELPEEAINSRKMLRLHIEEMDGPVSDIAEKRP